MLVPFISPSLSAPHGFFTRKGGVSTGDYTSLNTAFSSQDVRTSVEENRCRIAAHFGQDSTALITLSQIHSAHAYTLSTREDVAAIRGQKGDALVTHVPGTILGIMTADCAPVLFHDAIAGVIGAAHAGWNGAFAGIVEATVSAMEALGAKRSRIQAAIGPCIAQPSYEVDEVFYQRFVQQQATHAQWFVPSAQPAHWQFDLKSYTAYRLASCGITQIHISPEDTYREEENFFSYRRMTHRAEKDYGRQMSCIILP